VIARASFYISPWRRASCWTKDQKHCDWGCPAIRIHTAFVESSRDTLYHIASQLNRNGGRGALECTARRKPTRHVNGQRARRYGAKKARKLEAISPRRSQQQTYRLADVGMLCNLRTFRQYNLQWYALQFILYRLDANSLHGSIRNLCIDANWLVLSQIPYSNNPPTFHRQHRLCRSRWLQYPHPNQTLRLGQIPHLNNLLHSRRPLLLPSQPSHGPHPTSYARLILYPTINVHSDFRSGDWVRARWWED